MLTVHGALLAVSPLPIKGIVHFFQNTQIISILRIWNILSQFLEEISDGLNDLISSVKITSAVLSDNPDFL